MQKKKKNPWYHLKLNKNEKQNDKVFFWGGGGSVQLVPAASNCLYPSLL